MTAHRSTSTRASFTAASTRVRRRVRVASTTPARAALFSLPPCEADLRRHHTLSDNDLQHIGARRRPRNKPDDLLHDGVRPSTGL